MPAFVLRYVVSLAVLLAAYGLYALAAVPFIEREATYQEPVSDEPLTNDVADAAMRRQRDELAALFPKRAWEQSSPKVLATEQGKLLFEDYQPLPDGRMELKPCTLVFYAGGSGAGKSRSLGRPFVMRAAVAELRFDRPLHLGQTDIGRLLGGTMKGEITITSGESRPGADDELSIITRNVQLDEEHIWTPHEVRFRYGPSFGGGRDLTIVLASRAKGATEKKLGFGAEGVKSLELVHVDKLHLVSAGGGLLPGGNAAASSKASPGPLPVDVTCRGPFRFDFQKLVASFEDQVNVRRLHPGGAADELSCQLLELYFGKAQSDLPESAEKRVPRTGASMSGLEVQRLVAVGHPVVLTAGAGGASARGQRFEYDVRRRTILLEDGQKASLLHEKHSIEARGIAYEIAAEEGRLGRLWAAGPGTFKTSLGVDGSQPFTATWGKELRLRPHQGTHVISLTREAGLSFSNQGGIQADDIHVWLHEAPPAVGSPSKQPSITPDKMLAVGNVRIDSAQLSGEAPRLEAWFKTEDILADASGLEPVAPLDPFGDRRATEPGQNLARGPAEDAPEQGSRSQRPAQKFHITGQLIQVQMLRRGKQTTADNVTVDGQVRLVEIPTPNLKTAPLEMRGDTLQFFSVGSQSARARVTGKPAEVQARGMRMASTNIQMHQGENRLWIDGAGEMTLPAQRNPLAAMHGAGVDARREAQLQTPLAPGQKIHVTWQKRMNFDGQTVRFEQQVEARGETQFARGQVLEVTLTSRLDFAQPSLNRASRPAHNGVIRTSDPPNIAMIPEPSPARIDVQRLAFDGGVFLENRTVEDRRVTSIDQMQVRKLSIDNTNGRLHAVGPGWVSSVRLGGASPLGMPGGSTPARVTSKPAASDGLNYLHVDFQTALTGNLVKREIQFLDRVQAVYGPVATWEQQLSKDRLEDLPERGVLMNCDRLTVSEMGQTGLGQKLYEMEAAGSTRVEGKTFTATADRMTYAQAKDLIVLEGDGRADAELWRQSRVGGPTEHAAARKILFWQRENKAQVDDARFLDLSQFGAPPPRESPRK